MVMMSDLVDIEDNKLTTEGMAIVLGLMVGVAVVHNLETIAKELRNMQMQKAGF